MLNAFQGPEHEPFFWPGAQQKAVLLIHGFPGTPADMRPVAEILHRAGWAVQALLLPGFGPQIGTIHKKRYEDWIAAVCEALRDLQARYPHVILIGYSMGGALSIRAAAEISPSGLVLLAPFWRLDHMLWKLLPVLRRLFPTFPIFRLFKLDFSNPEVRAGILNFMPGIDLDDAQVQQNIRDYRLPIATFAQIRRGGLSAWQSAPQVSAPTLIVQGTRDELVLPALTRQLAARFSADVRFVQIDADHALTQPAEDWDVLTENLLDFLALVETTPRR